MHGYFYTFFVELRSLYVAQVSLKFLVSSDSPGLASQNTWIIGMSHSDQPSLRLFFKVLPMIISRQWYLDNFHVLFLYFLDHSTFLHRAYFFFDKTAKWFPKE